MFKTLPEIAELSVPMPRLGHDELVHSIRERGIITPILIWRQDRTISSGTVVTDFLVIDGYQRLRAVEELQKKGYEIGPNQIPWMLIEGIHSIEEAVDYAITCNAKRRQMNALERAFVYGKRYLMEKQRVGAPEGSANNVSGVAKISIPYQISGNHKGEPNVVSVTTLGSDAPVRTAERLAGEFGIGEKTLRRYAKAAENIENAVAQICELWDVRRDSALRCCLQNRITKRGSDRDVSLSDWERVEYLEQFPNFFTDYPKKNSHHIENREAEISAAVRIALGDLTVDNPLSKDPRYMPAVDADFEVIESTDDDAGFDDDEINPRVAEVLYEFEMPLDAVIRQEKGPAYVRQGELYNMYCTMIEQSLDNEREDPFHGAPITDEQYEAARAIIEQRRREYVLPYLTYMATNSHDKSLRINALKDFGKFFPDLPLPTDELEREETEAILNQRAPRGSKIDPSVSACVQRDWGKTLEIAQRWNRAAYAVENGLEELMAISDDLRENLEAIDALRKEGKLSIQIMPDHPSADRLQELSETIALWMLDSRNYPNTLVFAGDPDFLLRLRRKVANLADSLKAGISDIYERAKNTRVYKSRS
ncbi:MAG: hypothetical protein ACYCSS_14625 [Sulfuriferula sp.]